jgi:hypothetical protein
MFPDHLPFILHGALGGCWFTVAREEYLTALASGSFLTNHIIFRNILIFIFSIFFNFVKENIEPSRIFYLLK